MQKTEIRLAHKKGEATILPGFIIPAPAELTKTDYRLLK